jgi:radical SAM protein (TIGR01212 family)
VDRTGGRDLHLCVHVILGLPGENWPEMMATAECLGDIDVLESLKLHHLYVARGTAIEQQFSVGRVPVLRSRDYVTLVCDFLERIEPAVSLQRIVGDTTSPLLVAPEWAETKSEILNAVQQEFRRRGTCQGARRPAPADPADRHVHGTGDRIGCRAGDSRCCR